MRVCGVEFSRDTIQRIKQTLEETPLISRRALARCVCERLDWRAANGKCKEMVCRKALGMLERQGVIGLRAAEQPCTGERAVWEKRSGWVEPADVACDLSELGDIDIELVG